MLHMFSTAPKPDILKKQHSGEYGRTVYLQWQALLVPRLGVGWSLYNLRCWRDCDTRNHNWSIRAPLYLQACSSGCIFLCRLHMCPAGQTPAQSSNNHHRLHTSVCWNTPVKSLEGRGQGYSQHRSPGDSSAVMVPSLPHRTECSHHFPS